MTDQANCVNILLTEAAAIMRESGLARGTRVMRASLNGWSGDGYMPAFEGEVGSHCLLGAIDAAAVRLPPECTNRYADKERAIQRVGALITDVPDDAKDAWNWNDASVIRESPGPRCAWWSNMIAKDAEEVAALLEKAAQTS